MVSNRKILIVPDKFKGSLSAPEVADAIEEAIKMRAVHFRGGDRKSPDGGWW